MVTWNEAKEWFADYSEQVTLAIGGMGSDIAVEASDIVFVNDTIAEMPHIVIILEI